MRGGSNWLNKKTVVIFVLVVATIGGFSVFRSFAGVPDTSKAHVDFSEFHLNTNQNTTHYLSTNHQPGQ